MSSNTIVYGGGGGGMAFHIQTIAALKSQLKCRMPRIILSFPLILAKRMIFVYMLIHGTLIIESQHYLLNIELYSENSVISSVLSLFRICQPESNSNFNGRSD